MKKYFILNIFFALILQVNSQTVTDVDGNIYNTITIGKQVWLRENLNTTKYNNGTEIPNISSKSTWIELTTGAYCNYNNSSTNASIYGHLYNYYAVIDSNGLCPIGWHIPSEAELTELKNYLVDSVGGKLKEVGYAHWDSVSYYHGATNETGFSAVGSGSRFYNGDFIGLNRWCNLWTTTECSTTDAYYYEIHENSDIFYSTCYETDNNKNHGNPVRCLKDDNGTTQVNENSYAKFFIYPNPATNIIFLRSDQIINANLEIIDIKGKLVTSKKIVNNKIDLSNLNRGMYFIKITDFDRTFVYKLIKK